uniref:Uncharacterized protein n=1 Tax=Saccharolobus solfataricus (strain 98/2) TaxID=555311 RepID=D0KMV3_SACS9
MKGCFTDVIYEIAFSISENVRKQVVLLYNQDLTQ